MNLVFKWISSPVGLLKLVGHDAGLAAILWENDNPRRVRLGILAEQPGHDLLVAAERQLAEYFRRERKAFDVPLSFVGSPFQVKVWQALLTIPYGELELRRHRAPDRSARGDACRRRRERPQPDLTMAPCHRVVGASGALTGFAGGLEAQRTLLELEAAAGLRSA